MLKIVNYLKRIKRFLLTLLRRHFGTKEQEDIERIRNSRYFNAEYYLSEYPDIKESGIDPAEHYYSHGTAELRNPSASFNTEKFIGQFNLPSDKNPLIVCLDYIETHPDYRPPKVEDETFDDFLYRYFPQSAPLKTSVSMPLVKPRLNLIFNGFDKSVLFGGKMTALQLAVAYCNDANADLRIISQQPDPNLFYEFMQTNGLKANFEVSFFSLNQGGYLEIDPMDDFLCTMWCNADAVLHTPTITGRIFYIMQEVETFFCDHGDMELRAYNILSDRRLIPIVNTELLYDYLCDNGYSNVANCGCRFEPAFSKRFFSPGKTSFAKKQKHVLFYYAGPSHRQNLFYFGAEVLNEALIRGILDPDTWSLCMVKDDTMPKVSFDVEFDVDIKSPMSYDEYAKFLSDVDLCFSMNYTPHPGYAPLDAVSAGAVSLTNTYANKKDLGDYSANIVMAELNLESMLDGLKKAIELAENVQQREENYLNRTNTHGEWPEVLSSIIDYMKAAEKDV